MVDAITVQEITIKCDSCDFATPGDVYEWHGKACPNCGAPDIIDNDDIAAYRAMQALISLANLVAGDVKEGSKATLKIDSRGFKGRGQGKKE